MRQYVAKSDHANSDSVVDVVAAFKEARGVVLQWSYDEDAAGKPGRAIGFAAEPDAQRQLQRFARGWSIKDTGEADNMPGNNTPLGAIASKAGFIDHRMQQPRLVDGMPVFSFYAQKNDMTLTFNAAAAVLLKQPYARLLQWSDNAGEGNFKSRGVFYAAAHDRKTAERALALLPGWRMLPSGHIGPDNYFSKHGIMK